MRKQNNKGGCEMKATLLIAIAIGYLIALALLVLRAEATCKGSNLRFVVYGVVILLYVAIIIIGIMEKRRRYNAKIK